MPIAYIWKASFSTQSGIQPSDVQALELGQTTFGTVMAVAILSKLTIKGTKVRDKVQLTLLEGDKLKISVMAVKQEKIIQLKK